jgi:hypothetical protein
MKSKPLFREVSYEQYSTAQNIMSWPAHRPIYLRLGRNNLIYQIVVEVASTIRSNARVKYAIRAAADQR